MKRAFIIFPSWLRVIPAGVDTLAPDFAGHLQNLFAIPPPVSLEITMWPDYDPPQHSRRAADPGVWGRTGFLKVKKGGANHDRLFRSGGRHRGEPVRRHRQSPVAPDGRAGPAAVAATGDHRLLSDSPRRRHHCG